MNDEHYRDQLTGFIQQYVHVPKEGYEDDGNLKPDVVRAALKLLLDAKIFDSPEEIQREAFKDYQILIPDKWMEEKP